VIRTAALLLSLAGFVCGAPVTEERVNHAGTDFRVVRASPDAVQVVWKDDKGVPYRSFERVQAAFAGNKRVVRFMMNAGIFEPGGIPSGLHVEDGKTLGKLNLADAPGNFFLKPNGVFRIESTPGGRRAFVSVSEDFPKTAKTIHAVQSGPVLLTDGRRHPAFRQGSPNKLLRNGVGVDEKGRIVFAITARGQMVNLWDFAGLFLKLGCKDALFLDGDISQMSVNPEKAVKSNQFGAMFVIAD
jgi:uncharacterized protein YigE (DUF2233 family)